MRALLPLLIILGFAACATLARPASSPSFADARSVCSAIAEGRVEFLDVAGGYDFREERAWTPIDIDNDGDLDEVAIMDGGTSHTPAIEVRPSEHSPALVESAYADGDQLEFVPWSGQLKLVRDRSRVYEVFYSDAGTLDYPVYAAIHLPNGEGRWVCAFQSNAPPPRLEPLDARESTAQICGAISARRESGVEDFPFETVAPTAAGWAISQIGHGELDFMNDARTRSVRQLDFSNEAGSACHTLYYDIGDPQDSSAATALAALQGRDASDSFAVVRAPNGAGVCHGNIARFHNIGGSLGSVPK